MAGRREKQLAKLEASAKNASYDLLVAVLKSFDFLPPRRGGGSHEVWRRADGRKVTVVKARPVKRWYVEEVVAMCTEIMREEG